MPRPKISASELLYRLYRENSPAVTPGQAGHREAEAFDRGIDLRITRLRRKIEHDPTHPEAIRTVRGNDYMFVPPRG